MNKEREIDSIEREIKVLVDRVVEEQGTSADRVIPILQAIQGAYNYLPEAALERVCEITDITVSSIYSISTFYPQFRHKQVGKHIIRVCVGTACHVKGAKQVLDAFKRELNIEEHEDSDAEGLFTIDKVACLGCCTIAPVIQIDGITYGHLTTDKVPEVIKDFLSSEKDASDGSIKLMSGDKPVQGEIRVGLGSCCVASGSSKVKEELEKTIVASKINVDVKQVGCVGICNQVPMLEIHKPGEVPVFYTKVRAREVKEVVNRHFKSTNPIDRLANTFYSFIESVVWQGLPKQTRSYPADQRDTPITAFLDGQLNIATEYRGIIKPTDLDEYKSLEGFIALAMCLEDLRPSQIIEMVKESGLRGRGGGGFPTGIKWQLVKEAGSEKKYIICNGDEGDPGAFMDRMLLESYPFRIIEGMIIAGYAVGADEGIFYIREEYPLAVRRIREALDICKKEGILGDQVLGSNFSFRLSIFEGAGAFVCGEETALIASVEGRRGMPGMRPPYPAIQGLHNRPTLVNNTETFSLLPWIIRKGPLEFNRIGTENSKGTKVFALAGKTNRGGLIEVPMGITIRKIVEEIGGGVAGGRKFKAVQIGGPSGGCIPSSMADTEIDYESLNSAGAMMGSGGMIVLDDTDCMVDIARYFLSFTQDQSCGRCTFCRIGTRKMLELLDKICNGEGEPGDLALLEQLAESTKKGSMCGLGKTAPNPVLSTLTYFREEYEAHVHGTCPAGKCEGLITYDITEECNGCTLCAQKCPSEAILATPYELHRIDTEKCIKCDICKQVCPVNAVITR